MNDIPESDWKKFRRVREAALERLCERAAREVAALVATPAPSHHKRFLDLYKLVHERNDEIAVTFDNPRRSAALLQLVSMRRLGLVTESEFGEFSATTQQFVNRALEGVKLWRNIGE